MASPGDCDFVKADDDLFSEPLGDCSGLMRDLDSQTLANHAEDIINFVNDDGVLLPNLSQASRDENGTNSSSSSLVLTGRYPSVEEYCLPCASFLIVMPNTEGSGFVYSEQVQKLFIKLDSICSFEARCEGLPMGETFFVRAMLVSIVPESKHEPLLRCRNHQAKDEGTENEQIKEHIVRCKNEQHEYVGRGGGSFFEDRCAVRVPLDPDGVAVRLTVQFVCQNTCFSPALRKTGLVFTLEDASGHVWGRRMVQVKVCTNYRRDMLNEEKARILKTAPAVRQEAGKKRLSGVGRPKKRRTDSPCSSVGRPKRRLTLEPTRVTLEMPSLRMARRVIDSAIGIISNAVLQVDKEQVRSELMEYVEKLRGEKQTLSMSNSQYSVDSVLL